MHLDSHKQRLLLAALTVASPRAVALDRLVDMLWEDELPAEPASALQIHVSRLRQALGGGHSTIVTERHGYRLAADVVNLDSARFEDALNGARRSAEPQDTVDRIEAALDLWRGDAFEGLAGLAFVRGEAARLDELLIAARELRAEALIDLDRLDEALAELSELAQETPLRERPRALQMKGLYRQGRQADALAVFREYRLLMASELGLEPSPSLAHLEASILAHDVDCGTTRPTEIGSVAATADDRPLRAPTFEISYLEVKGHNIAVGRAGAGPVLVTLPGFVSNLSTIASGEDFRSPLLGLLADQLELVTFDRAGTGLSPGAVDDFSLATAVAEAEAVLDGLDLRRAAVLGISASGPIATTLAARRPDLVSHLILLGTYASGPATFTSADTCASLVALVRSHWGLGSKLLTDLMYPSATAEFSRLFARGQRDAAPAEVAAGYLEAMFSADASPQLRTLEIPTLVLHYSGDRAIPFGGGRALAAAIPGARFLPLGGSMHLPEGEDAVRVSDEILRFVRTPGGTDGR